jgi:hypothetical protein
MDIFWEDFNTMSFSQLCKLPGIGRTTAIRIIENRPYRQKNDLFKVRGLGKNTLASFGIEKDKKTRRKWMLMEDGIEYPTSCLAKHTSTGKIDFFWRIPKDKRQYL